MESNGKASQHDGRAINDLHTVMVFMGGQRATFRSIGNAIDALDRSGIIRENGTARDILERRSLSLCAESVETWP